MIRLVVVGVELRPLSRRLGVGHRLTGTMRAVVTRAAPHVVNMSVRAAILPLMLAPTLPLILPRRHDASFNSDSVSSGRSVGSQ